jgi:hypothetical protein
LATSTNDGPMELAFNGDGVVGFLANLVRDGHDLGLRVLDFLLSAADSNLGRYVIVTALLNINLSRSIVLDLVNGGSTFAEDASNRTSGYGELDDVVVLFLEIESLQVHSSDISSFLDRHGQ